VAILNISFTAGMDDLTDRLKAQVIKQLNLLETTPEDIDDTMPLFVEGLGLDSIDALELRVLLEKEYGLKVTDPKKGRAIFYNIKSIADYIRANQAV
jgi:acyl carrier protein